MKNILDIPVSYYSRITSTHPVKVNLYDLLTTARYKEQVLAVRKETDPQRRHKRKNLLPAFTPSGLFTGGRADTLIKPTALICIDIDKKDNQNVPDYENLKKRLGRLPHVAFCGISAGGEGYYAIIPIACPDQFLRHFRSLQREFAEMGITLDPACCDISRKRFVSYDPEPYINPEADIYEGLSEQRSSVISERSVHSTQTEAELLAEVNKYVRLIEMKEIDITESYSNWLRIGYALFNTFGESGRELFHAVSCFHPKYKYREADNLFTGLARGKTANPIGIGTFFRYARQYGLDKFVDFME